MKENEISKKLKIFSIKIAKSPKRALEIIAIKDGHKMFLSRELKCNEDKHTMYYDRFTKTCCTECFGKSCIVDIPLKYSDERILDKYNHVKSPMTYNELNKTLDRAAEIIGFKDDTLVLPYVRDVYFESAWEVGAR